MVSQDGDVARSQPMRSLVTLATASIGIIAILLFSWLGKAADPQQVFWGALSNSLSVAGVTIETAQKVGSQSERQFTQVGFGAHPRVRSLIVLQEGNSTVKTEDLITPTAEYTRYDSIQTNHKTKTGKPINFSSILGVWARTTTAPQNAGLVPPVYGQVLLGLSLPFGDLDVAHRSQLLEQLKENQVYNTAFPAAKKQQFRGRLVYVYKVSIQPLLYIQYLKSYAADVDLHQLDSVNPNSYGGQPAISMTWTVDAHAEELVRADYGGGRVETYSGFGIPVTTPIPAHPISAVQLQQRLSRLLNS